MTTLVIGSGLVGSQVARILVERGEKPVLMEDQVALPKRKDQAAPLAMM
jgi:Trk K+ transport system NAD-binding subunit